MRKISKKTFVLLNAKPGDIFVTSYQADIPKRTCARHGVTIQRQDCKALDKSYILVL